MRVPPLRPLIAITTSLYPAGRHRLPHVMIGAQYLTSLEDLGATSLLLTPAHDHDSVFRILDVAHGLVLTGGEDVDPRHYGEEPHPKLEEVNPARDEMELAALSHALERDLPLLAICRGIQVLNVGLGGTLYQDLPSQFPDPLVHQQELPVGERSHCARIERSSGFHRIFGVPEIFINSFHHQGIKDLAPTLRATVRAEDGLIEGVETDEWSWVYGVQWHPERHQAHTPPDEPNPDRRLFGAFVEQAGRFASQEAIAHPTPSRPGQKGQAPARTGANASGRTER